MTVLSISKGSEPSLGSRNGQHSSHNASKRTLNSQENLSPVQRQPAANEVPLSAATEQSSSTEGLLTANNECFDVPPNKPSYVGLSCKVSGYSLYNNYGSSKDSSPSRLRVIKTNQNGSATHNQSDADSHLDSQPIKERSQSESRVETDSEPIENNEQQGSQCTGHGCAPLTNGCDMTDNATAVTHNAHFIHNDRTDVSVTTKSSVNSFPAVNGHDSVVLGITQDTDLLKDIQNASTDVQNTSMDTSQTSELQLELKTKSPEKPCQTGSPATPAKDGHYFINTMHREEQRIRLLCESAEHELDQSLPEEVSGKIRAAIGKANLLITKKFKQFRDLCDKNINQGDDEPFPTTPQDLAGFWDLVLLQVDDINVKFEEISQMKRDGWKVQKSPVRSNQTKLGTKSKSPRAKAHDAQRAAKNAEAAKARELARQRLLAAKKAGRERKISESDKDEVQIYVN